MSERSNIGVVIAVLAAGGLIAGSRPTSPEPTKPDPFQEVKAAVAAKMVDPGSATFQGLSVKVTDFAYCGEVNAKNRMGGYVGFQKFYAQRGTSGEWLVMLEPRSAEHMCK
jgi:hypothetical protein